jgi:hypothetical protein
MLESTGVSDEAPAPSRPEIRALRRVAICVHKREPEEVAALLRHELEHSIQFDEHPDLFEPLPRRSREELEKIVDHLPGTGVLYNQIPNEIEANSAAAKFVRCRYGDGHIDSLPDNPLYRIPERDSKDNRSLRERIRAFVSTDAARLATEWLDARTLSPDQ